MKLDRPPFRILTGQSPEDAAVDIVAAFESIESAADKLGRVFATLCGQLQSDADEPLCAAGRALAAAIDAGAGQSHRNAYHNPQHFCEVMLGAHFLCLLQGLGAVDSLRVVLAALIHDFHHDGSVNRDVAFRLERLALQEAAPYLCSAGVSAVERRRLSAMVLATDVAHGLDFAIQCHAHHAGRASQPTVPAAAPELGELAQDPSTALQALVLCQADLLPSTGLTPQHALRMQDRLSQEWRKPLALEDKLCFIDQILSAGITCSYFIANLHGLRQTLADAGSAPRRA
ncbi:hypothetical protein [Methylibium sp.]|uniref:hypothetical protein n=1 Tax=Methylibium sp. TaxID=2067992 RepID=UPI00178D1FA5|nr:hypothetical protein [Methylibium sp.]MBA3588728.1 hypothetical protein [Methylibium sp.]